MTQLSNQKSIENGGFYPLFGRKEQSENKLSGYFAENKGYLNPIMLEIRPNLWYTSSILTKNYIMKGKMTTLNNTQKELVETLYKHYKRSNL